MGICGRDLVLMHPPFCQAPLFLGLKVNTTYATSALMEVLLNKRGIVYCAAFGAPQ
jgi:hypothetical protein